MKKERIYALLELLIPFTSPVFYIYLLIELFYRIGKLIRRKITHTLIGDYLDYFDAKQVSWSTLNEYQIDYIETWINSDKNKKHRYYKKIKELYETNKINPSGNDI